MGPGRYQLFAVRPFIRKSMPFALLFRLDCDAPSARRVNKQDVEASLVHVSLWFALQHDRILILLIVISNIVAPVLSHTALSICQDVRGRDRAIAPNGRPSCKHRSSATSRLELDLGLCAFTFDHRFIPRLNV